MSTSPLTVTIECDASAATTALEFALAQLPPLPEEDEQPAASLPRPDEEPT